MKILNKYPQLGSSANPEKVAMTFRGVALALLPLIIMVAKGFSLDLSESEIVEVIEAVTLAISSVMIVFGLVRKVYYKYFNFK